MFDTLVWSGDGLEIEPRLATSWKAVDPTTWEFKLRPNVKFHDGSDFTAEDVKFSITRMQTPMGPNPTTIYVRRVKEVQTPDPLTVRVVTDGPAPNLPNDFIRLFIVSHKAAAGVTKENANEVFNSGKAAVGTGPYKFVSWTPKGDFVAERFDGYWGGKEPWAKHRAQGNPERCLARRAAQGGPARPDHARAGVRRRDAGARPENLRREDRHGLCVQHGAGDAGQPPAGQITAKDGSALPKNPLQDTRVREAIDLAIDRKALAEIAMEGFGKPVNQLVTPSIFGYNKALPERKYDVAAAKKLMADAGYPNGFKISFAFTQDRLPGDRQVGTTIAQMLAAIGIDAQANAQPAAVFFPARTRGEYSMSMSGWGTLTGEAHYTLSSVAHSNDKEKRFGAFNALGYKNDELDKPIQDAAIEMDEGKRRALLEKANEIVLKDRPRLPIVAVGSAWAMQKGKFTIKARVDEDTLAMNIKPATN